MRTKRQQQHTSLIKVLVAIGDFFWINVSFLLMIYLYWQQYGPFGYHEYKYGFVVINLAYAISLFLCGIILDKRVVFSEKIIALVTKTVSLFAIIVIASFSVLGILLPAKLWLLFLCISFIFVSFWRIGFRFLLKSYRRRGGNTRNIIILGAGRVANKVYNSNITNEFLGYNFMGFFDDRDPADYRVNPQLVKGTLADVEEFVKENQVDEIICALPAGDDRKALPIMKYAEIKHFGIKSFEE